MVNFTLIYKPYSTTMESEHYWTMWKNIRVFKKVIATKNSNNVNMDNECLELNTHTNSTSAITTTILVTIFTYLIVRSKRLLKLSTSIQKELILWTVWTLYA